MAISLVGTSKAPFSPTTSFDPPVHQAGDLILYVWRNTGTNVAPKNAIVVPGPGSTVPSWTTLANAKTTHAADNSGGTMNSWAVVWAWATAANHTSGTFANADTGMCAVFRAISGKVPTIVGVNPSVIDTLTQAMSYPALTASKKDSTSLGVRIALSSIVAAWTNGAVLRDAQCFTPRTTDNGSTSAEHGGFFVSSSSNGVSKNLVADMTAYTTTSLSANLAQKTMAFEVIEANPVTAMVMAV
jgi:hypothetical protein